ARFAPEHAQLAIEGEVLGVTLDGDNVNGFRLVRVHVNHESEVGGQITADFFPVIATVVRAHDVPMLLHEERVGTLRMHSDVMDTVSDLGVLIGDVLRAQTFVDGLPGRASVIGAEGAGGGDGDVNPLGIFGIKNDG